MAEAMELDLTIKQPEKQPIENPIPPQNSVPIIQNTDKEIPKKYTIENYYKNDHLGSDVLKQKYLAYMRPIKIKLDSMEANLNFEEKLITIP